MRIGALKETGEGEARVAVTPASAMHLKKLGHEVFVEAGAGERAGFADADYAAAGVTVLPDAATLTDGVDVVAKVRALGTGGFQSTSDQGFGQSADLTPAKAAKRPLG